MDILKALGEELHIPAKIVTDTVALIDDGNTIPFIARYRKEVTNSMDDQLLRQLDERLAYMRGLEKRKTEVIAAIDEQGKMTEDITAALEKATTLAVVEDIYRPYKQKRKTRASVAKARGLQPLADIIFAQNTADEPIVLAEQYIDEEKEVPTAQDALNGALDIIAETISDDATMRAKLRNFYAATALVVTRATDAEKESVYSPYY
ncbi:MAG: Tex-like N-terminal domain-containing protein, partial [Oscillospiraceae bacterium]